MSSIREVARAAGVSVATVSRALATPEKVSETSLKKVRTAIASVGYRPNLLARNFRSARSYSIVVLVPDITNPFFSQVIQAVEDTASQRGYAVLMGDTRESAKREQEYINRVETRLADGVIQLRPETLSKGHESLPWVNACGCNTTTGPSVRIDNVAAAKTITEHLIGLGHRRIGVISGLSENPHSVDRLKGFRQALKGAKIKFDNRVVIEGDFTLWSGQQAAKQFCAMGQPPTAIFCMNDEMALGAIQTLKSLGFKIPEDVSVTGFDDIHYAKYWDPPLTTIAQPAEAIGQAAANLLLDGIENGQLSDRQIILPYELAIRSSTGRLRDASD